MDFLMRIPDGLPNFIFLLEDPAKGIVGTIAFHHHASIPFAGTEELLLEILHFFTLMSKQRQETGFIPATSSPWGIFIEVFSVIFH